MPHKAAGRHGGLDEPSLQAHRRQAQACRVRFGVRQQVMAQPAALVQRRDRDILDEQVILARDQQNHGIVFAKALQYHSDIAPALSQEKSCSWFTLLKYPNAANYASTSESCSGSTRVSSVPR